ARGAARGEGDGSRAQEEVAAFNPPGVAVIEPVAEPEAAAGPLLVIDVAAAEEDGGAGAQGAAVAGVAGGHQGRGGAVLDPPQQVLRLAPQPAGPRLALFARKAKALVAEGRGWWTDRLRGGCRCGERRGVHDNLTRHW